LTKSLAVITLPAVVFAAAPAAGSAVPAVPKAEMFVRDLPTSANPPLSNVLRGNQKDLPRGFLMVGHRGNTDDAPESTLPAFAKAIERGDDGIEFDVRWTSDGHAVVMHDDMVDRTTNGHGYVAELTEAQIERLDAGSWFSPLYAGIRVPSAVVALQEIAQRSATVQVFVHVKVPPTAEQATALVRAAAALGERVTFMVEHDNVAAVLRAAGATRFGLMVHRPAQWNATGYRVFVPYSAVDPALVTAQRIAAARARGILVIPVVGYPMTMQRAVVDGADGVYTDADIDCARPFGIAMCHAAVPAPERR
jgi:glycerophosphoryl diester phosphodiesterase